MTRLQLPCRALPVSTAEFAGTQGMIEVEAIVAQTAENPCASTQAGDAMKVGPRALEWLQT